MLERGSRAFDLSVFRGASELGRQFVALRKARCSERMPLAQQSAGWVDHYLAIVGGAGAIPAALTIFLVEIMVIS